MVPRYFRRPTTPPEAYFIDDSECSPVLSRSSTIEAIDTTELDVKILDRYPNLMLLITNVYEMAGSSGNASDLQAWMAQARKIKDPWLYWVYDQVSALRNKPAALVLNQLSNKPEKFMLFEGLAVALLKSHRKIKLDKDIAIDVQTKLWIKALGDIKTSKLTTEKWERLISHVESHRRAYFTISRQLDPERKRRVVDVFQDHLEMLAEQSRKKAILKSAPKPKSSSYRLPVERIYPPFQSDLSGPWEPDPHGGETYVRR